MSTILGLGWQALAGIGAVLAVVLAWLASTASAKKAGVAQQQAADLQRKVATMGKRARLWAVWLLSMTMLLLPSCTATTTAPNPCGWVRVISVSPADQLTGATARQILAHNRATEAVCR
jgi:hypothetical protein